jgi:hypothetical protein
VSPLGTPQAATALLLQTYCRYVVQSSQSNPAVRPSIVQKIEPPGELGHDVFQGTTLQPMPVQIAVATAEQHDAQGVLVAVFVGVLVDVLVAVLVGVLVEVLVGVFVGVSVGVLVAVFVGVSVGVLVGVFVGVSVGVLVAVLVGVGVGLLHAPLMQSCPG